MTVNTSLGTAALRPSVVTRTGTLWIFGASNSRPRISEPPTVIGCVGTGIPIFRMYEPGCTLRNSNVPSGAITTVAVNGGLPGLKRFARFAVGTGTAWATAGPPLRITRPLTVTPPDVFATVFATGAAGRGGAGVIT